jgi:hypothetical protein
VNVTEALARGRARAEALMVDECAVTRPDSAQELTDPHTGEVTFAGADVYVGRCKVQTGQVQEATPDTGGRVVTIQRYQLHLPVAVGPVRVGDLVKITAAVHDAQLVDKTYRVTATHHKSMATAQRTEITEVTA